VAVGDAVLLDEVDLDVAPGEWVNVVGPNGAGKTTLLRCIAGLRPYAGTVELGGSDAAARSRRERARLVALVPQSPVVPRGMTVSEYVLLGRTPHLSTFASETADDLAATGEAIEALELGPFVDRPVETLSGGERQRVIVARMLAQDAPVALLDEPTAALDVGHQQQVLDLIDGLRRVRGLTVVTTLHDLTLAGRYGERVVLLVGGRVVASGPATEVLTEELVARHYGARVRVIDDGDGPVVVPVRPAPVDLGPGPASPPGTTDPTVPADPATADAGGSGGGGSRRPRAGGGPAGSVRG
jgi:iron complex transport system ATP-binding protein